MLNAKFYATRGAEQLSRLSRVAGAPARHRALTPENRAFGFTAIFHQDVPSAHLMDLFSAREKSGNASQAVRVKLRVRSLLIVSEFRHGSHRPVNCIRIGTPTSDSRMGCEALLPAGLWKLGARASREICARLKRKQRSGRRLLTPPAVYLRRHRDFQPKHSNKFKPKNVNAEVSESYSRSQANQFRAASRKTVRALI